MKFAALVKFVPDTPQFNYKSGRIDRTNLNLIPNPEDLTGVEMALRGKEKWGGEVVVISMSPRKVEDGLREILGMGADRCVLIELPEGQVADGQLTAEALGEVLRNEKPDFIFTGVKSADAGSCQIHGRLSAMLGVPAIVNVKSVEYLESFVRAEVRDESVLHVFHVSPPAIVGVLRECGVPRLADVMALMEAYSKEIETFSPSVTHSSGVEVGEIKRKEFKKKTTEITGENAEEKAKKLLEELRKRGLLGG